MCTGQSRPEASPGAATVDCCRRCPHCPPLLHRTTMMMRSLPAAAALTSGAGPTVVAAAAVLFVLAPAATDAFSP